MPKAVFCGELKQGKRDRGAPKKRFKDQLKQQLSLTEIDYTQWEHIAEDRESTMERHNQSGHRTVSRRKKAGS